MIYPIDNLIPTNKGSISKLIRNLLILHLLIVCFMIPIRSIFLDLALLRDIIPLILVFLLIGIYLLNRSIKQRTKTLIDRLIIYYLSLGIFITIILVLNSGLDILPALVEFRNHFFPFILFFVARKVITESHIRIKISNILFIIMLIFLISTFLEYIFIKVIGISPFNIHWYNYTFINSDRYIGNVVGTIGYINPIQTPIIGFLGWPHATAAFLMCLTAFNYPFLINRKREYRRTKLIAYKFPLWLNYTILLLVAFVIFVVLYVKMHMLTFIFLVLIFPYVINRKKILRSLILAVIIAVLIMNFETLKSSVIVSITEGYIGTGLKQSSLDNILDINVFPVLSNLSLIALLFGDYYAQKNIGGEFRLINYTLRFGLPWLIIFSSFTLAVFFKLKKCITDRNLFQSDQLFITGITYFLLIAYIDMGHYARAMTWPIIDLIAISLGSIAPFFTYIKLKNNLDVKG